MNKKFTVYVLVALLVCLLLPAAGAAAQEGIPEHTASFYVNDFAGVIDLKTENALVHEGVRLHRDTGAQVVLVTVDSTNGQSMQDYANLLFNGWGVGDAVHNNGVLLLLSVKDDDYWVVQGKGLTESLSDTKLGQILAADLEPDFANKQYSAGARKTYNTLIRSLGGQPNAPVSGKAYVADNAGIFKQVTKDYLNQAANRYRETAGGGIYVVTVPNSGSGSLQDYTYAKFASVYAGPSDVMIVLDIGGDNYHVLQGKEIDSLLSNEVISGILEQEMEPYFAEHKYAEGATATANAIYSFLLARADDRFSAAEEVRAEPAAAVSSAAAAAGTEAAKQPAAPKEAPRVTKGQGLQIIALFLIGVLFISLRVSHRNRRIALYGMPINPYSERNIRRYGTWTGQAGYGYFTRRQRMSGNGSSRPRHHHHQPSRSQSSSSWSSRDDNTNRGGGGHSSGGGAGRHSESRETNRGSGGHSSGGDAGRNNSGGSSNSGGGGNASSGGGVGRHR
ncbi:TPM domain-containing protein [Paenibacillus tengchongensis]|uniref:TPM domain-containing protein n=1 Tax=Paenibacillus tengchongensis TaxID=2608684 RepID=UPI0016529036|nr:TPM domain-containing protein [Paenibacillus tengchongensis]